MPDDTTKFFARLIGINQDTNPTQTPSLGGCINDVHAVQEFLCGHPDLLADNIQLLRDNETTHRAMKENFRSHLNRECARLDRTVDTTLDIPFTGDHHLVIGIESMQTVRKGHYPDTLLQRRIVPCNHFSYFDDNAVQAPLSEWMQLARRA